MKDLNRTYATERALHEVDFDYTGFQWIDCNDSENSVVSFIRRARDSHDLVVALMNFTPVPRDGYRIGVPEAGGYIGADQQRCGDLRRQQPGEWRPDFHASRSRHTATRNRCA